MATRASEKSNIHTHRQIQANKWKLFRFTILCWQYCQSQLVQGLIWKRIDQCFSGVALYNWNRVVLWIVSAELWSGGGRTWQIASLGGWRTHFYFVFVSYLSVEHGICSCVLHLRSAVRFLSNKGGEKVCNCVKGELINLGNGDESGTTGHGLKCGYWNSFDICCFWSRPWRRWRSRTRSTLSETFNRIINI